MGFFSSLLSQISKPDSSKMSAFAGLLLLGSVGAYTIDCHIRNRQSSYLNSAIPLKEFGERLKSSSKPFPVVFSGQVHSNEPIKSGLTHPNPSIRFLQIQLDASVIYDGKTEIVYEDRDSKGDEFSSILEVASIHEEVSWHLVDGPEKVRVVGIQKAIGFDLIACKREVAGPGTALLKVLPFYRELDDRRGIKVLGVKHCERALKVDTSLTVIGKAVKEESGDITILEPLFVCQSDKDSESRIILFDSLSAWQIVSMSAFVTGSVILVVEGLCDNPPSS